MGYKKPTTIKLLGERIKREHHTRISNNLIRDPEVSANGFRVAAYLLSLDDGFTVNQRGIATGTGMTRNAVSAGIKNLVETKWLKHNEYTRGDSGHVYCHEYVMHRSRRMVDKSDHTMADRPDHLKRELKETCGQQEPQCDSWVDHGADAPALDGDLASPSISHVGNSSGCVNGIAPQSQAPGTQEMVGPAKSSAPENEDDPMYEHMVDVYTKAWDEVYDPLVNVDEPGPEHPSSLDCEERNPIDLYFSGCLADVQLAHFYRTYFLPETSDYLVSVVSGGKLADEPV